MTTMHIQNIVRKKSVPTRYMPNSYRIFCEDIGNQSIPDEKKYMNQAPDLYTQPMIVPAQAIEDRNKPHGARAADFLRENARTLNEPVNKVRTKNVDAENEKRWWEWSNNDESSKKPANNWKFNTNTNTNLSNNKRSVSSSNLKEANSVANLFENTNINGDGYQTTYQKEHGYSKHGLVRSESGNGANRHASNPNSQHAIGIVPITDLTSYSKANEPQRVFVDKVSFEQAYDSRNDNNYPMRGRRHGAFVMEQELPKPSLGIKSRPDANKGTSVWDAMHPNHDEVVGNPPPKTQIYSKPPSGRPEVLQNQRRDPIGYFEDTKFGAVEQDVAAEVNNNHRAMNGGYQPSWNNSDEDLQDRQDYQSIKANDLLDNAMRY